MSKITEVAKGLKAAAILAGIAVADIVSTVIIYINNKQ